LRIGTPTSTSVRREHQAALDDLRNHLGRAGREQLLEIGVVDGAHDRRQRRRQLVHVVQHRSADGVFAYVITTAAARWMPAASSDSRRAASPNTTDSPAAAAALTRSGRGRARRR
jgi:hypothetical protein